MSKAKLKKSLDQMSKEQIAAFVIEMYENSTNVKAIIDGFISPEKGGENAQKYKKVIEKEFYPKNPMSATHSFSNAKNAIKEYKETQPTPKLLADLMMDLPEMASRYTNEYGDMWSQYYTSTENNFEAALKFIQKHDLLADFKARAQKCVKYSENCGYGFADNMEVIYSEFYPYLEE
jgi:cyclopropane fatty-acyl-phospholipid synthase-like methyltransferase